MKSSYSSVAISDAFVSRHSPASWYRFLKGRRLVSRYRFVSGHEFSRAEKSIGRIRALARRDLCRPYGTRVHFPLHPALRLRLRAGLTCFAPMALVCRQSYFAARSQDSPHAQSGELRFLSAGANALIFSMLSSARLKSCPDTNQGSTSAPLKPAVSTARSRPDTSHLYFRANSDCHNIKTSLSHNVWVPQYMITTM
jgi:hypothetical protein